MYQVEKEKPLNRFEKISENKFYEYYAYSDGYVTRILKSNHDEARVSIRKNNHGEGMIFVMNGKATPLAQTIAKAFVPDWYDGCVIFFKDGDKTNCRADNLIIGSKKLAGQYYGGQATRSIPVRVIYPNGKAVEYESKKAAAQALFVSYPTIKNYINRKYETSVLDGYKIKEIHGKK